MSLKYLLSLTIVVVVVVKVSEQSFADDLLTASENVMDMTEDLAQLLKLDYDRQGTCGSDVSSECCTSCSVDGYCYNGGTCCEIKKVKTRFLRSGEDSCPSSWGSDCQLTQMVPVESGEESDSGSSSSSGSSEDRQLDKSGLRIMCVCVSSRKCCSGVSTTTPYPTTTYTPWITLG